MSVGITGHRPNRMHVGVARVEMRLTQVLGVLKRASRKVGPRTGRMVAISALAEGADRLFAQAALAVGADLVALLPFASADYETTFSEQSETPKYRKLLERATKITELPGTLAETKLAYEAVGQLTVGNCDVLLAVWDGRPAAGRGGTSEVIQFALDGGKPVIWIDAASDRPPLLLRSPTASGPRRVGVQTLARRARPITRRRFEQLAASSKASRNVL